jgi:hypothetical protein
MQWRQDPIGGLMVGTPENLFQRHLLWPNFAKVGELAQAVIAHSTIPTLKLLIKDPSLTLRALAEMNGTLANVQNGTVANVHPVWW